MNGGRRLQPGYWLLIGIVVLLVAGGVAVVLSRGDADPTVADPTTTPQAAATSSVAPRPDCAPEIVSTWADGPLFAYGLVYRSKCDQVVGKLRFRVAAVDQAGAEVSTGDEVASGGVLFPGGELAVAGDLRLRTGAKVAGLKAQVIDYATQPATDYSGWAQPEVIDPVRGKADSLGAFTVTGTVRAQPPSTPICVSGFVLVLRDKTDKILYVGQDPTAGESLLKPEFKAVPPLPALDFARTKIYAPQAPRTAQAIKAGAACDGS